MTITAVKPGLRAVHSPYTPISYTVLGVPVYSAQGGRSGGGIQFIVGDDEGADPDFDDERDDDDDDDDDDAGQDDEPAARRTTRRRGQREDDEADGDDDGDTDWTPPTREAWERVNGALKRANGEAGKRRRIGKVADKLGIDDFATWLTERGIDPDTGRPYGNDVVDPDDSADQGDEPDERTRDDERARRQRDKEHARALLTAEKRGEQKAREQLMPVLAEHAARLALRDAGFSGDDRQLRRIMRTIDPDELDLDLDGDSFELVGIEEAVIQLQEDFPELFEERKPARRRSAAAATTRGTARATRGARDVDGGGRGRQQSAPKTWQDKILAQMVDRGQV
jgi:hypothetical protein